MYFKKLEGYLIVLSTNLRVVNVIYPFGKILVKCQKWGLVNCVFGVLCRVGKVVHSKLLLPRRSPSKPFPCEIPILPFICTTVFCPLYRCRALRYTIHGRCRLSERGKLYSTFKHFQWTSTLLTDGIAIFFKKKKKKKKKKIGLEHKLCPILG